MPSVERSGDDDEADRRTRSTAGFHGPLIGTAHPTDFDPAIDQADDPVGRGGDALVVRHHDYSEVLLAVQAAEHVEDLAARLASRLPVGSSASRSSGPVTSARAMAARCISPPESSRGLCLSRWPRPTISSSSAARARCRLALQQVAQRALGDHQRGEHVFERGEFGQQVVELEDHAEAAVAQRVAAAGRAGCRSAGPSKRISPSSGASSVPSRCSSVLLPEPLWPTMARNSPRWT